MPTDARISKCPARLADDERRNFSRSREEIVPLR
jgi:hypothetical protein